MAFFHLNFRDSKNIFFEKKSLSSPRLHLIDQKYSKTVMWNITNLKNIYILIHLYFKM